MMTLKGLSGGPKAARDVVKYCEHEQEGEKKSGYYSKGGAPSSWSGEIARELGLSGPVDGRTLQGLLEGKLPDDTRFASESDSRRMAVDLTFSAPKGVSLAALASDLSVEDKAAILAAHHRAVTKAQQFVEREFVTARYKHGGAEVVKTNAALWASYTHEDARPVDGIVSPQIHTHGLLLNVTRGKDGDLRALDLDFGQDGVLLGGAVYRAALAAELKGLGHDLRKTQDGFDLACVSDQQISEVSLRSGQIKVKIAEHGLTRESATAAQKTAANLSTREGKGQLSQADQMWQWRTMAREIGLQMDAPDSSRVPVDKDMATREHLSYATERLSERESVINGQSVRLAALVEGMYQGVTIDSLDEEITDAIISGSLHDAGRGRLVTRETLATEARILHTLRSGRDTLDPITTIEGAQARIDAREKTNGFAFSQGQKEAVVLALTSTDQVVGVVGAAGAGKSTAMSALSDEAHERGIRVVGLGPSQTAADGLKGTGADDVRTLASFCEREDKDHTPRLILMDEAGMVSSRDMDRFLQKITPQDRVVLIGDPLQLSAVESGSPFAQAMKSGALQFAEISEINRQKDAGLLAVAQAFADGDTKRAVGLAEKYMSVAQVTDDDWRHAGVEPSKEKPPQTVRATAIARATAVQYLSLTSEQRDKTLMLSGTNSVRRTINQFVREGLKTSGAVSPDAVTVTALDRAQLTRAQLKQSSQYEDGMILRLTEGRGRSRTTTDYSIASRDLTKNTLTLHSADGTERVIKARDLSPDAVSVYTTRSLSLAPGDRVVFTENQRTRGFQNNETGSVVAVTGGGEIEVRKDNGEIIKLDASQSQHLDHGWAVTVHRSQGRTIDRALVAGEASRTATAQNAYVACSREKWDLRIITDNVKRLQTAWSRVAERETAHDALSRQANASPSTLEAVRETVRTEVSEQQSIAAQEAREAQEALAREQEQEQECTDQKARERIQEREQEREMER